MKFLSWLKEYKNTPLLALFAVAAALPAYILRFRIGPVPMTGLEVVELGAIITLAITYARRNSPYPLFSKEGDEILSPPLGQGRVGRVLAGKKLLTLGSALILIATIIGIIVAPDKRAALGIAKAYFWEPMLLTALIIAAKPDREKAFKTVRAGFALSAAIVIAYGLIQYAFPGLIPATWTAERRITSVFEYPNAAALFLAPLIPFFFSSPSSWILSASAVATTVLAKSAGGAGAIFASLVFLGSCLKKTRLATAIGTLAVIAAVALAPQLADLRTQILMKDWSGRVHRIGWNEAWSMLKDHPLFGAGLSGFPTAAVPYHRAQGVEIFQYPHNLFLTTWSELGIIGLVGFSLILIWFFYRACKLRAVRYAPYIAAAMVAILAHGLVDVPYFKNDLAMMFWLFAVLVAL